MKILVVLAHPDPASLNYAIAQTSVHVLRESGHEVIFHDLYTERFDPILPADEILSGPITDPTVATHCRELADAEGIVIIHPNWWGQPPAILKGWIDRIIRPEVAYRFLDGDSGEGIPQGLLKAETAVVFNTSNTSPEREESVFGDPLERLWKDCIFQFCGVKHVYRTMFRIVVTSTPQQRQTWLEEVRTTLLERFPVLSE